MARTRQSYAKRLKHWSQKVSGESDLWFAPAVGRWAVRLLEELDRRPDRTAEASSMAALAVAVGIPGKVSLARGRRNERPCDA